MVKHKPHPGNVPGDFYVEDGCCTMCKVPFSEAPDLFGVCQDPRGYDHCFVKRQPGNAAELGQMIRAIRVAELDCIRYRGRDCAIQQQLVELGEGAQCDLLAPDRQQSWWQLLCRRIFGRRV